MNRASAPKESIPSLRLLWSESNSVIDATMQNMLRFHGCTFPKDNEFYKRGKSGLQMLDCAAETYKDGEGWRLFGLMKQMLEENHFDINAKMKEWADAKKAKHLER